eukprot:TRINITY_DN13961_c1_g1_i1.p1 TRINITY_DN13961_c1_g1~~TRINITY_DN13961_c1_g1_i1.p1  ORF type:complete len:545 (+),score=113.57 TRINITY_DN13961_c1_g1_i1:59-1636(+)
MGAICPSPQQGKDKESSLAKIPGLHHMQLSENYIVGKKLATKVACVKHTITHALRVCYQLRKESLPCQDPELISERISQLRLLDHPNICTLHEAFDGPRYLFLIYEQLDGRLLLDKLADEVSVSEHRAAGITRQVVCALNCGLEHGIACHGAVLPKNLSLSQDGMVKVTDFGLAGCLKRYPIDVHDRDTFCTLAPEILRPWVAETSKAKGSWDAGKKVTLKERDKQTFDVGSDVWSLGVVLYLILTGNMPFFGMNLKDIAGKVLNQRVEFPCTLSGSCQELLTYMFQQEPSKRPSVAALLKHPWISESVFVSDKPACPMICEHLKTFNEETGFKRLMMRFLATKVPKRKIKHLKKEFELIDTDGDGILTFKEFKDGICKHPELMKDMGDDADIERAFKDIDHNQSGSISLQEFLAAVIDSQADIVDKLLWDSFRKMDKDGSGCLSLHELEDVLHKCEGQLGKEHVELMMHVLETEVKGGALTFADFKRLVTDEGGRTAEAEELQRGGLPCCAEARRQCRTIIRAS